MPSGTRDRDIEVVVLEPPGTRPDLRRHLVHFRDETGTADRLA